MIENAMDKMFRREKEIIKSKNDIGNKENVLITGIGGFVGSHLANTLKNRGCKVIGIVRDMIPSDWLMDAFNGCTILNGDIRNRDFMKRIIKHYQIEYVYHLASFAYVKQARNLAYEAFDTNVMGTLSILEACKNNKNFEKGNGNIIVLNTDKVYGEKMNAVESDNYDWSEPYATSKSCQGFLAKTYGEVYDMNIKVAHSCNIFGYDPFNDRLIPNTIKACIRGRKPVIYTNDKSIREYVFINDAVDAIYSLSSDVYDKDSYNISTGYIFNQEDIVNQIIKYYNDINFENIIPSFIEGNLPKQIQNESMKSVNWSWHPSWKFEDGLHETIDNFMIYKTD